MKKKTPIFKTDEEAEKFVDTADLTEYDLSGLKPVQYEFEKNRRNSTCVCRGLCLKPSRPALPRAVFPIPASFAKPWRGHSLGRKRGERLHDFSTEGATMTFRR